MKYNNNEGSHQSFSLASYSDGSCMPYLGMEISEKKPRLTCSPSLQAHNA